MKRFLSAAALLPAVMLVSQAAFAETVELVTYYPTASNQGDLHIRSLTVGTAYQAQTPGDGTALISDKLGIGTTNPQMDLDIYRADEAYLRVSGTGINAAPENFSGIELGADLPAGGAIDRIWQIAHKRGGAGAMNDLHVNYFDGTSWSTKMAFQPNGNIGIGTATPGAYVGMNGGLTVNGAGGTQMTVERNGDGFPSFAMDVGNGRWTMYDSTGGPRQWHASLSSSNGNVTMGGTLAVGGAVTPRWGSVAQRLGTGNQCSISGFYNNGGPGQPYLEIDMDNIALFGISLWPSSREQKTDISAMEVDTSKIYDLEPVSFRYKHLLRKEGSGAGRGMKAFGLIAEDVEKYFPQLVMRPGKGGKIVGLDYGRLSVLLLPEMKKLKRENLALGKEVETLKKRLDRLEKKPE